MGGVIVNDEDDWFVANYEYRQLLTRARQHVDREEDKQAFVQAEALHGLLLQSFPDEQAMRIAAALRGAAEELRREPTQPRDSRDAGFRHHLVALEDLLDRFLR
jgi:hypothetical protein